jgi:hypothetical protein
VYEISNSEMRSFQRCRRQWALTYHYRWQPRLESTSPVGVAQLGTRVHLALEAWYGHGIDPIEALTWAYELEALRRPDFAVDLGKELDWAKAMVEGYVQWLEEEGVDVDLEAVAVERELKLELRTNQGAAIVRAKLDQLVRRRSDGALLVRDFKTVGTLSKADQLVLDQQMRFYALLLSLLYPEHRVDGALYTMLKRSKRTLRAKPPFYEQVAISYNKHDLNSTFLRVTAVVAEIVATHRMLDARQDHRLVTYPNPSDYCDWGCPFNRVCPLMDDGSRWEAALEANFTRGDPYQYYERDTIQHLVAALGKAPEEGQEWEDEE